MDIVSVLDEALADLAALHSAYLEAYKYWGDKASGPYFKSLRDYFMIIEESDVPNCIDLVVHYGGPTLYFRVEYRKAGYVRGIYAIGRDYCEQLNLANTTMARLVPLVMASDNFIREGYNNVR